MDFEEFDERLFSPDQTSLNRFLRIAGVLLLATAVLPIDRTAAGPVNIWDRFGVISVLETIRLVLPAVVGLVFVYLGWFARLEVKLKAAGGAGALAVMLLFGVNPFEVLRIVLPPISADPYTLDSLAYTTGVRLRLVNGEYFPREDTLHLVLLGFGLAAMGVGGRYRATLQSSRIGAYIMMGATVLIAAYYVWPYGGKMAAQQNVELYRGFHQVATKMVEEGEEMEDALEEVGVVSHSESAQLHKAEFKVMIRQKKMAGQLKLSSVYFMGIYFLPALIVLFGAFGWGRSRYKGHRAVFGRLGGWGASVYLLAFLLPLLFKEGMRKAGPGFLPNLRSYIILAAVFVGVTLTVSMLLQKVLEPDANDDALHEDPLAWQG